MSYSNGFSLGNSTGTSDRTVTGTPAADTLGVVFCTVANNSNSAPTCSDDQGGAYDLIDIAEWNDGTECRLSCFVRTTLFTNVSTTVTVATGSNDAGVVELLTFDGMTRTGTSAVRSKGKQEDQTSSTPAPALNQACLTGNMTVGCVGAGSAGSITEPTSWLESNDKAVSTPTTRQETVIRNSGFTGTTVTWGASVSAPYASMILELDGSALPVLGVLAQTLGALTLASAGTVPVNGVTSATLGALTLASTGNVPVNGVLASTLGAITLASTGTTSVLGVLAQTLGALTLSSEGTVTSGSGSSDGPGALGGARNRVCVRNYRGYR